ncbi:MAG: hypothetical protein QOE39_3869, partial [Bradyrhizobium sp.]|nr:hypothetical protein [Bradyrhizobium sp.]
DPWGNARSTGTPKADANAASKTAAKAVPAKRTKTSSTPN